MERKDGDGLGEVQREGQERGVSVRFNVRVMLPALLGPHSEWAGFSIHFQHVKGSRYFLPLPKVFTQSTHHHIWAETLKLTAVRRLG